MIDLERFFENHFDTDRISDDKLRRYSERHLGLLATNDTEGRYGTLLEDTNSAHITYFGSHADEDVKFAVQQGYTKQKDAVFQRFKQLVSQKEGIIRGTFGKDSPQYEEIFPLGLSEYTNATLSTVDTLMNRMVTATGKFVEQLGQELVDLFTDIRDEFMHIRQAQVEKMGEVAESKADTQATRDVLEEQLMKNVLVIAADNIGHPERVSQYFDQSLL